MTGGAFIALLATKLSAAFDDYPPDAACVSASDVGMGAVRFSPGRAITAEDIEDVVDRVCRSVARG